MHAYGRQPGGHRYQQTHLVELAPDAARRSRLKQGNVTRRMDGSQHYPALHGLAISQNHPPETARSGSP